MIRFNKLFNYLNKKQLSQNTLVHDYDISSALLHTLRHSSDGEYANIQTMSLVKICKALGCTPQDIMEQDIANDDHLQQIVRPIKESKHQSK